jgi:hypothetical protein
MAWVACIALLLVYGGAAARDAVLDKSPRAPEHDWWRRRPPQAFWARRHTPRERMRGHIKLRARK